MRAIDEFPVRVLGFVLVVMALLTAGLAWYSQARFESFVECQARWSNDLRAYAEGWAHAAADERAVNRAETAALNRLVREVTDDDIDDEAAFQRWREALALTIERRREIEQQREENPLPEPPIEVCNHVETSTP